MNLKQQVVRAISWPSFAWSSTKIASLVLVLLTACGGGGGGGSPTAPRITYVQVAGSWGGSWYAGGLSIPTSMQISQTGSSISGTIIVRVLSTFSFPISGTVSTDNGSGGGTLDWSVPGITFGGKMAVTNSGEMIGDVLLDNHDGHPLDGLMDLYRHAALTMSPSSRTSSSPDELLREVRRLRGGR